MLLFFNNITIVGNLKFSVSYILFPYDKCLLEILSLYHTVFRIITFTIGFPWLINVEVLYLNSYCNFILLKQVDANSHYKNYVFVDLIKLYFSFRANDFLLFEWLNDS